MESPGNASVNPNVFSENHLTYSYKASVTGLFSNDVSFYPSGTSSLSRYTSSRFLL